MGSISNDATIEQEPGLHVSATRLGDATEWFVLASPLAGEHPLECFRRAANAIHRANARILNQFVWYRGDVAAAARDTWETILGSTQWPVSWMIDPVSEAPFGGVTIRAVSDAEVSLIRMQERIVGCEFETEHARYVLLGDVRDTRPAQPPAIQAQHVFDCIRAALEGRGMDFSNVIRTWFFNSNILAWYNDFNAVRSKFFKQHAVVDQMLPASTGIGAHNLHGSALISSVLAAAPKTSDFRFYPVPSPRQCPAVDYGSRFSRAVEVVTSESRHLVISGTASVNTLGKTIHQNDVAGQTRETLDAIQQILSSRDMDWSDALQGVAYVRNREETDTVLACLAERGLSDAPFLLSNNIVCRDDLLFELELQASAHTA